MPRSLVWKLIFYAAVSLFAILLLLPTATTQLPRWWSKILPAEKIRLGLDLEGGMYLLLEVEAQKAIESYLEQIRISLQSGGLITGTYSTVYIAGLVVLFWEQHIRSRR